MVASIERTLLDLARFCAARSACLSHLTLEFDRTFPAEFLITQTHRMTVPIFPSVPDVDTL